MTVELKLDLQIMRDLADHAAPGAARAVRAVRGARTDGQLGHALFGQFGGGTASDPAPDPGFAAMDEAMRAAANGAATAERRFEEV